MIWEGQAEGSRLNPGVLVRSNEQGDRYCGSGAASLEYSRIPGPLPITFLACRRRGCCALSLCRSPINTCRLLLTCGRLEVRAASQRLEYVLLVMAPLKRGRAPCLPRSFCANCVPPPPHLK